MKGKTIIALGAAVPILLLGVLFVVIYRGAGSGTRSVAKRDPNPLKLPAALLEQRSRADGFFAGGKPKDAIAAYAKLVETNATSKDKNVQDQVARARIRIGFSHAKMGRFKEARATFLEAEAEFKGTEAMDPEFGGLPDQAAYQAAVCLVAQGEDRKAEEEFRSFIKGRPLSPLVFASFNRLKRLAGGDPNKGDEDLLQQAIAKQEDRVRREITACGPKTIAYLLPLLGLPAKGYQDIAKLCGTGNTGTSMDGMRRGLKALGVQTYGLLVNRRDLATVKTPAILLENDHYVTLLEVKPNSAEVYDTRYRTKRSISLPPLDDASFQAAVLVVRDVQPSTSPRK